MAEYIEREALLDCLNAAYELERSVNHNYREGYECAVNLCCAADVVLVVREEIHGDGEA